MFYPLLIFKKTWSLALLLIEYFYFLYFWKIFFGIGVFFLQFWILTVFSYKTNNYSFHKIICILGSCSFWFQRKKILTKVSKYMYFQVILARNFFRTILKTKCVKYAHFRWSVFSRRRTEFTIVSLNRKNGPVKTGIVAYFTQWALKTALKSFSKLFEYSLIFFLYYLNYCLEIILVDCAVRITRKPKAPR